MESMMGELRQVLDRDSETVRTGWEPEGTWHRYTQSGAVGFLEEDLKTRCKRGGQRPGLKLVYMKRDKE